MTGPDDPLDLEASSALDDDHPAGDERSPELTRRIEAFRQVRAAVGAPVGPPPTQAREAAVAAALEIFDAHSEGTSEPASPGTSVVTPLRRARPGRWLGAAAAAAALVLGAAAVLTGGFGGTDQDETAATADEADARQLDAADAEADVPAPVAAPEADLDDASMNLGGAAGDGADGPVELGTHDDVDGLVRSLTGPVEESQRSSLPTTTAAQDLDAFAADDACDDTRSALEGEGPIVLEGDALVAGALVRVFVVDTTSPGDADEPGGRPEVVLADPGGVGCPVLERVPLG